MPFVSISRPAIGISILKAVLVQRGIPCDVRYASLKFAERIGLETYAVLDERVSDALFAGDWLFAQHLFGDRLDLGVYDATLRANVKGDEYRWIMDARAHVGPFLEACLEELRIADYDIIGFTTTFEQNCASLALARDIKARWPDKTIVFGGGNCEGDMGRELHRSFPWIDFVCSGEGEQALPLLVEAIASGQSGAGIPGIVYRDTDGQTIDNGRGAPITDLDAVPSPDYDEYFAAIARSPLVHALRPSLLIETSRGCWWGARSHCTFCGLNGSTMAFRSKSPERVYAELEEFRRDATRRTHVMAVDNILDMRYFRDVLPRAARSSSGAHAVLRDEGQPFESPGAAVAGFRRLAIQPGVESLSSHVLQLMRKGVTALQNIQLLKWCSQYQVTAAWNLLYGFPGETVEDYEAQAGTLDALWHLAPPHAVGAVRMDRFSPYYDQAKAFGMVNVRPMEIYSLLYPVDETALANLAYFFTYEREDGTDPETVLGDIPARVERWRRAAGCRLTASCGPSGDLVVTDTRPEARHPCVALPGVQGEVYAMCDTAASPAGDSSRHGEPLPGR